MSTHNICFYGELEKIITEYSALTSCSLPSADSRRAFVSFWQKNAYNTD